MNRSSLQRGFSLIELLVAMAITIVAVAAAVLLITKFARTAGAYGEVSTLEEQRGSADTLLRSDFDGAGYNLTRPSAPGAGSQPVQFLPNPDYNTTSPGTLSHQTGNATNAYSSKAVTSGISLWTWTPSNICRSCWTYVVGTDGSSVGVGISYGNGATINAVTIWESVPGYVASNFPCPNCVLLPAPATGDTYQIGIEAPNGQQPNRFIRYYRIRNNVRSILYTSASPVPPFPLYMVASLADVPNALTNVSVIGAPIENRAHNQTEFAHLPFDGGTQLTSPITLTANTAIILSGDKTTDAAPALTAFSSASTQIDLKTPARGSYAAGDTVLLVDYGNADPSNPVSPASAVCQVTTASNVDSQTTRLTLARSRQANPAWGRLWSSDTDHAHTFPASETSVIKLAPPVTYALSTDSRLVRVEGARVSTVAFNVRQLTFSQGTGNTFIASAVIAAEGVETANDSSNETRSTIQFASTPRAMNLASNQQN